LSKKRNRSAIAALRIWAIENSITDNSVLEDRFYQCIERPDPVEAVNRVMSLRYNSFLASVRNKDGIRIAFPVKNSDGSRSIHIIPGTSDLSAVAIVDARLSHNSQGNNKTRKPVRKYKEKLIKQYEQLNLKL